MICKDFISVIVPVYNAEKYLDECINSIVRQTYTNIEILLVDDGSIDSSNDICREWIKKDKRIRLISQENGGVAKARNAGIDQANGEFLLMVDSDDYIAPTTIETMYDGFLETGADIVICDHEQGEIRNHSFAIAASKFLEIDFETIMNRVYEDGHDALRFIAPWGKLYRKELFSSLCYPEGKIFEDIYITHRLLYKANKIVLIDQKLVYYFHHEDSIMHRPFHLGKLDYLGALKERMEFFRFRGFPQLEKKAYEEYIHSLIWEYSRVRDILHDEDAMKEIRERFRREYKQDYTSERYPQETAVFLKAFNMNPELIILYWRISAKLKHIGGRE